MHGPEGPDPLVPIPMGTSAALSQGSGRASGRTDDFRPAVPSGPHSPADSQVPRGRTPREAGGPGAGRTVNVPGSAVRMWWPGTSRHTVAGTGRGRFSIAAAITSGNRSGVQANAGAPRAASAAACSRS